MSGRVVWITGLSGSGKSTVAALLTRRLGRIGRPVVLLDGDRLRRTIAADLGYDLADRRRCAERYARLAHDLARQGLTVVVATISMFEAVRRWNRRHAPRYLEVYLRLPPGCTPRRPRGRRKPPLVVGLDLPFEEPARPNLVFERGARAPRAIAADIERRLRRGR